MLRTFVAVELPEPLRRAALEAIAAWLSARPGARHGVGWVRLESMHLTLKFIGWAAADAVGPIREALSRSAASVEPFDAEFGGAGGFPNLGRPRVVWVGLRAGAAEMTRLRDAVEAGVAPLGFPTEGREFHPHLTLGRVKDPRSARTVGEALRAVGEVTLGPMRVDRVTLFQSELKPGGAVYTPLGVFPLGRASPGDNGNDPRPSRSGPAPEPPES